ncbi:CD225/dispanin family protein [Flammeovirga pacifica]|uniref:CD225/dispanin family protein n=1 Tax=Flammeovirga pacifica TaxID=915059 RepID=A0A1S1YSM0_FLAPC|nr:CD225/dispanin family protein [Flammeovirga pacifica]OHX63996.1 hypothetical protein NH26_20510 [Flammeovirga pacifica]
MSEQPPKSYLVESILVTLFCCLPFGIAGIVNASKVESRFYAGDKEGAQRASDEAKKWMKWGIISAAIFTVLYIFIMVVFGVGAATNSFY